MAVRMDRNPLRDILERTLDGPEALEVKDFVDGPVELNGSTDSDWPAQPMVRIVPRR